MGGATLALPQPCKTEQRLEHNMNGIVGVGVGHVSRLPTPACAKPAQSGDPGLRRSDLTSTVPTAMPWATVLARLRRLEGHPRFFVRERKTGNPGPPHLTRSPI